MPKSTGHSRLAAGLDEILDEILWFRSLCQRVLLAEPYGKLKTSKDASQLLIVRMLFQSLISQEAMTCSLALQVLCKHCLAEQ
jgi:hypothetical protein